MPEQFALMWMEDSPKVPLERRLRDGADVYQLRVGKPATRVIVSLVEFDEAVKAAPDGVTVVPSTPSIGTVARNIYWFMGDDDEL